MENIEFIDPSKMAGTRFWTRDSSVLLGGLLLVIILIGYFWWPLVEAVMRRIDWSREWWLQLDWLLLGIFAFTSLTIVAWANFKTDALIIFVGICGGLLIEAWGTQTNLWHYYTAERPPLWIIPAWPIANLSIDRITRTMDWILTKITKARYKEGAQKNGIFKAAYWLIFISFLLLMISFVAPTLDKSFTVLSLLLCTIIIFTPTNYRYATLIFIAGSGLGYFLELWGTTNHCWTYYTLQTPPLFAVLAHGIAAVAFWRAGLVLKIIWRRVYGTAKETARLNDNTCLPNCQ